MAKSKCCPRLSGIRPSTLFSRAKKEFGTTDSSTEAGWILPDGSMLDFSGKREGGSPGVRHMDHREVGRVFPDKEYEKYDNPSHVMMAFCWAGAVRVSSFNDFKLAGWQSQLGYTAVTTCRPPSHEALPGSQPNVPCKNQVCRRRPRNSQNRPPLPVSTM